MEVAFEEGPVNLNWSMIMKTVNEDPAEFYRNGGWNFLGPGSDVSIDNPAMYETLGTYHISHGWQEENAEDQSESASEFEMSEEEFEESESDDESDFASEASDESMEEEELSDSGDGKWLNAWIKAHTDDLNFLDLVDWDELEEKARKGTCKWIWVEIHWS